VSDRQANWRPHVLIVSDDPGLVEFLGEGLVIEGFWTSAIASAFQALEVFRMRTFDVVVLDAALGGPGAMELLRRLRGRSDRAPEGPRTDRPILVAAASPEEIDVPAALDAGADGMLLAPVELEDAARTLFAHVAAWRERHPGEPWADQAVLARAGQAQTS